jgi:alkyl hydroperoxide reductase subunit D
VDAIDALRAAIPDSARDIRINLQNVLKGGALSEAQRWGVAVASAIAARNPRLRAAVVADAERAVGPAVLDDARAAAALMAMNNIYSRFRHMVGKPVYGEKPAGLRMTRLLQPATRTRPTSSCSRWR